jgi:hypothetical protein
MTGEPFARRRTPTPSSVARLTGTGASGLPPYIAVPNLRGGTDNLFHYAAYLGGYANPFIADSDPNDPSFRVKNLRLPGNLSLSRLEDRRRVLEAMDQIRRAGEPEFRDLDAYYQRAFEMLTGKAVAGAFDIAAEPALNRDRYGRQPAWLSRPGTQMTSAAPMSIHANAGRLGYNGIVSVISGGRLAIDSCIP